MSHVILLVHEHVAARTFIHHVLVQHEYLVVAADTPDNAIRALQSESGNVVPDLILTGASVLRSLLVSPLRQHVPAQRSPALLVINDAPGHPLPDTLLQTSPEPQLLLLALRKHLHRNEHKDDILEHEGLRIDAVRRQAWAGHLSLELTTLTFRLLHLLVRHPGRLFSRQQLLDEVWNDHGYVDERTVDVHIYRLRNQLARAGLGHLVESVRGSGYRIASTRPSRRRAPAGQLRFAS